MKTKQNTAILWAILAAALYAISTPFSKILLNEIPPTFMAALVYLGAAKTSAYYAISRFKTTEKVLTLNKQQLF